MCRENLQAIDGNYWLVWMKMDTLHLTNVCKVADVVEKISSFLSVLCLTYRSI